MQLLLGAGMPGMPGMSKKSKNKKKHKKEKVGLPSGLRWLTSLAYVQKSDDEWETEEEDEGGKGAKKKGRRVERAIAIRRGGE